jgi:TonB family protein
VQFGRGRELKRIDLIVICALTAGSPAAAHAQTSSISISGGAVAGNAPMELRDGEYPLDAMLQDEQGDVKLSFRVDPTGHPADMRLLSSSGSQTLDLQSIRLANSKWTYESGQSAIVELILSWKLPLDHVGDYDIKIARSSTDTQPPVPIQSHAVVVDDYPPLSIRLGETGIVGIRYVVKTDGSVGLVEIAQSSGIKRLDDAALNMVKSR